MLKMLAGKFHLKRCGDQVTIESTANFGTPISDESKNVVFFLPTKEFYMNVIEKDNCM